MNLPNQKYSQRFCLRISFAWLMAFVSTASFAQERAAYIYPSWDSPKVVLVTAGNSICSDSNVTAIHTNGVLRLYSYRTSGGNPLFCTITGTGGGVQTATPERVDDLRRICAASNCEEPVQRVELYEANIIGIDANCVRTQGTRTLVIGSGGEQLPCAPNNAQNGPLFRYKPVGPTPIFPLPNRSTYSANDPIVFVPQEIQIITSAVPSDLPVPPVGYAFIEFRSSRGINGTSRVELATNEDALLARFYRSAQINLPNYPDVVTPTPVQLLMLRPGKMLLTLGSRSISLGDNVFSFSPSTNQFSDVQRQDVWPRRGGVFDVNLASLPFDQFKIGACVANTDTTQPIRYECPVQYDNGTRGKLIERDGLRFQLVYADCRSTKTIDLAPEGFGRLEWYIEDRGPDPYASTAMALKRGQMRVKLFASLREGEVNLTEQSRPSPWCLWRGNFQ
jgi:hypothetical protein